MAHHAAGYRRLDGDPATARALATDHTQAPLAPPDRALCDYVAKLTRTPDAMVADDVAALRVQGFEDRAILDACQVAAYYAFANRIIAGLGVELEPDVPDPLAG